MCPDGHELRPVLVAQLAGYICNLCDATIDDDPSKAFLNGTLEYLVSDPRTSAEFAKLKHRKDLLQSLVEIVEMVATYPKTDLNAELGAWTGCSA